MLDESAALLRDAIAAIQLGETDELRNLIARLPGSMPEAARADPETVQALTALLRDRFVLEAKESWDLFHFLLSNWEWVGGNGSESLRQPISDAFERIAYAQSAFIIAELLGEKYGDREALFTLRALAARAGDPVRAYVPHGLECFARTTKNPELKQQAIETLEKLEGDANADVRAEAAKSLRRCSR